MTTATCPRIETVLDQRICIAAAVAAAKTGYQIAREGDIAAGSEAVDTTWYRLEGRRAARLTLKAYGFADEELQHAVAAVAAETPELSR